MNFTKMVNHLKFDWNKIPQNATGSLIKIAQQKAWHF
jgi:hypothetical protein